MLTNSLNWETLLKASKVETLKAVKGIIITLADGEQIGDKLILESFIAFHSSQTQVLIGYLHNKSSQKFLVFPSQTCELNEQ